MRAIKLIFLLAILLVGCRQGAQKEAGPNGGEMEKQEEEAPVETVKDSLDPLVADTPEMQLEERTPDTLYNYFGRTRQGDDGVAELIGSASSVRFRASGDTLKLDLEVTGNDHGYALVTRNDKLSWKYRLSGGKRTSIAIPLTQDPGWNEIGVYKLTEAVHGGLLFHGARASGLSRSSYDPELAIEFIGNSMTCGYGVDQDQVACGEGVSFDQHNPYEAFAAKAARTMGAAYNLSAVSGAGVYRNYGETDVLTIPERYGDLYLGEPGQGTWPPENWDPDIVSICLGTNDVGAVRNGARAEFDRDAFVGSYIEFVNSLRVIYPEAAFVLVDSPMLNANDDQLLKESLNQVRDHFSDELIIGVLNFKDIGISGCEGHPGIQDHDQMARQLRSFLIRTLDEIAEKEEKTMS